MRTRTIGAPALLMALALALAACGGGEASTPTVVVPTPTPFTLHTGNPSAAVTLQERGSALLYPYLQAVAGPLHAAYSNITLSPATGDPNQGISDANSLAIDVAASDAYLSPEQMSHGPNLANIPVALSAEDVYVNLPGVSSLQLTGDVIARIYMGKITTWNDSAITTLNSGINLPGTSIVPVRRSDSSVDTLDFTSFLSATNSDWSSGPGLGSTVSWPSTSSEVTAGGNADMVTSCQSTPGCIAYAGISAQRPVTPAKLTAVKVQNKSGQYVNADSTTIPAAAGASAAIMPPTLAQSLIYQTGDQAYPIVNYEYLVASTNQKDATRALAIRTFLAWMLDSNGGSGQQYLAKAGFLAVPDSVMKAAQARVAAIMP